jgi:hypothetical protein
MQSGNLGRQGLNLYCARSQLLSRYPQNTLLGNGIFDAQDTSKGSGTAGTANIWTGNHESKDNLGGGLGH